MPKQERPDRDSPLSRGIDGDDAVQSPNSESGPPATNPTSNAPPSPVDILGQIFPARSRHALENVLRECNGDLVRALERCARSGREMLMQHAAAAAMARKHQQEKIALALQCIKNCAWQSWLNFHIYCPVNSNFIHGGI